MSSSLDRQIRLIYDAIDSGSNKSAVVSCTKFLKKNPTNGLVKALKALALVRLQKVEESLVLCDEVLASKPTDEAVLTAMMHVLRQLGRNSDMVSMYDNAYKQEPTNEELGIQTFFANVRTGNWKAAQQVTTKMHKHFQSDRYLYWSVMSAILQANDPSTPPALRPVLYKLAHRLVTSSSSPSYHSADRFYLHLVILRDLQLHDEAYTLLTTEVGRSICATSLICDEIRREIYGQMDLGREEGVQAHKRISENKDRNWLEFLSVVNSVFADLPAGAEPRGEIKEAMLEQLTTTREFLNEIAAQDGKRDRSGLLALLELEKSAQAHGLTADAALLETSLEKYFELFSDKACCADDLKSYIQLDEVELSKWTTFLQSQISTSFTSVSQLLRTCNAFLLLRYNLSESELTLELESARGVQYTEAYLAGLAVGKNIPETDVQPADDLALLAGHAFVTAWSLTKDEKHLFKASAVLEYASARSKQSYKIRLLLVRIYRLLGAPTLALEHYRLLSVKQVQNDTLSHYILERASMFSLAATGDLTYPSECLESSQIYMSNSLETADFIVRAFSYEKYTQISDFVIFEDRLDNSLQRDLVKVEHVRMRITYEPIHSELIDTELIELKFIFDRFHHDNRDFEILPNYQPRCLPTFDKLTTPFSKHPEFGFLSIFLKIYIKAFQQASDLDDSVEDKLLVGDRPKASHGIDSKLPLKDRLSVRKPDELDELTADERQLVDYATAFSDWLAPYHDYIRPPPSVVLAEAAKLTELKTGKPLAGVEVPKNGATNGHAKKDEEAPSVTDAPEILTKFYDDMKLRFRESLKDGHLPYELLHVATITQEAFAVFAIETARFKTGAVVKANKLGALVQSFKEIRTKATAVLGEMSAELIKLSEQEDTADKRRCFVEASKPLQASSGLDHDYVLGVAKKVTDARKQVLEGIGKGLARISKTHS